MSGNIPNPNRNTDNTMSNTNNAMSNANNAMNNATNGTNSSNDNGGNKKGCLGKVILVVLFVSVVLVGGLTLRRHNIQKQQQAELEQKIDELNNQVVTTPYEETGRYIYDGYLSALRQPNDNTILTYAPTSFVQKEWSYTNENTLKQNWILSVCSYVQFRYPTITNEMGEEQPVDMLNGESLFVTVVDYKTLAVKALEEREKILKIYKEKGYSPEDFDFQQEMIDLMLDYLLQGTNYPTKEIEVKVPLCTTSEGTLCIDDTEIDRLLFSSDDFHLLCDSFAEVIATYEYDLYKESYEAKTVTTATTEAVTNPVVQETEINQDMVDLVATTEAPFTDVTDTTRISEVTDENGNVLTVIVDEVEETTVSTTKEPLMTKEEMFPKESIIPYTWIGVYYCENEYTGAYNIGQQIGNGTIQKPAGEGTEIITKALCEDGNYHNVKVTLVGCYVGKDAIAYIQQLSEKNRGWDVDAVTQLITYEIKIENLDEEGITVKSEMFLSDANANKTSRVGTVYGFKDSITLKPKEVGYINDWSTSTELQYKYVCWGSSFARQFPVVWFNLLAGGTEPKPFDASASFVGADREETTIATIKEIEQATTEAETQGIQPVTEISD